MYPPKLLVKERALRISDGKVFSRQTMCIIPSAPLPLLKADELKPTVNLQSSNILDATFTCSMLRSRI